MKELNKLLVVWFLVMGGADADELSGSPADSSAASLASEQAKAKNRPRGSRVIEYGENAESDGGVVRAVVQEGPKENIPEKRKRLGEQKSNQKSSVKLITGGNPSDGNAKSGQLPVLD